MGLLRTEVSADMKKIDHLESMWKESKELLRFPTVGSFETIPNELISFKSTNKGHAKGKEPSPFWNSGTLPETRHSIDFSDAFGNFKTFKGAKEKYLGSDSSFSPKNVFQKPEAIAIESIYRQPDRLSVAQIVAPRLLQTKSARGSEPKNKVNQKGKKEGKNKMDFKEGVRSPNSGDKLLKSSKENGVASNSSQLLKSNLDLRYRPGPTHKRKIQEYTSPYSQTKVLKKEEHGSSEKLIIGIDQTKESQKTDATSKDKDLSCLKGQIPAEEEACHGNLNQSQRVNHRPNRERKTGKQADSKRDMSCDNLKTKNSLSQNRPVSQSKGKTSSILSKAIPKVGSFNESPSAQASSLTINSLKGIKPGLSSHRARDKSNNKERAGGRSSKIGVNERKSKRNPHLSEEQSLQNTTSSANVKLEIGEGAELHKKKVSRGERTGEAKRSFQEPGNDDKKNESSDDSTRILKSKIRQNSVEIMGVQSLKYILI